MNEEKNEFGETKEQLEFYEKFPFEILHSNGDSFNVMFTDELQENIWQFISSKINKAKIDENEGWEKKCYPDEYTTKDITVEDFQKRISEIKEKL